MELDSKDESKCYGLSDAVFWRRQGASEIRRMLAMERFESRAKNVIIFIGDGMGIQTHALARIYKVMMMMRRRRRRMVMIRASRHRPSPGYIRSIFYSN